MAEDARDIDKIKKLVDDSIFQPKQAAPGIGHNSISSKSDVVAHLNKTHASIIVKGKYKILRENPDGSIEFMEKKDFISNYENYTLQIISAGKEGSKFVPWTDIWLKGARRHYNYGITFD